MSDIETQKEKNQQSIDALAQGLEKVKSQITEKELSDSKKDYYKKTIEQMLTKLSEHDHHFENFKNKLQEDKNLTPELIDEIKKTVIEINIEQLEQSEIKKIEESVALLKRIDSDLWHLQDQVKGQLWTEKLIEQQKKETFETIKTKLKEHWYSAWAADGVYEFLMDKYIHKKESGWRQKLIYGSIGMLMIGALLPGKIEDIIKSIESWAVKKVKDLFDPAKAQENLAAAKNNVESIVSPEQIEYQKQKILAKVKETFEKGLGRKLDTQKFKAVFEERYKKNDIEAYIKDKQEAFYDGRNVNWLEIAIDVFISPIKSGFSLLSIMQKHGLITPSEIVIQGTKQTGSMLLNNSIEFWVGAMGLAGKTMGMLMGTVSLEQVRDYAKDHFQSLDGTEKALLFGMMYRHGGIFQKIATGMVAGVGHLTSFAFTQGSESMSKLNAFKSGFMNDFDGQLKLLKELEWVIWGIKLKDADDMRTSLKKLYSHQLIYQYCHEAKDVNELKSLVKKANNPELNTFFSEIFVKIDSKNQWNFNKIVAAIGTKIDGQTTEIAWDIGNIFDQKKNFLDRFHPIPEFSAMKHQLALGEHIKNMWHVQKELLQKNEIFHFFKKYFHKVELGKLWMKQVDMIWDMRLYLKDVTEAKDFFNNMRTLVSKSPEIATTLLKQFPVILVGGEVLSAINSPDHKDHSVISEVLKGLGALTPLVGPLMLLSEGLEIWSDKLLDLKKAWLWAWLLTVDGYFAIDAVRAAKMVSKSGWGALWKYMANPVIESAQFVKSVTIDGAATLFKMTKDGLQVAKTEGLAAFAAESLNFFKGSTKVLWVYALIAGMGYVAYKQRVESQGNDEQRELFAELEKDSSGFETKVKKEWKSATSEQKSQLIKVALMQRWGVTNAESFDIEYADGKIKCKLHTLINKTVLLQQKIEILEAIKNLDGVVPQFDLRISRKGSAEIIDTLKEQYGQDKNTIHSLISQAGYSDQDITTYFSI